MTEVGSTGALDSGPILRARRPFVSFMRPAPLIIAGCAVSVVLGVAAFLGLRTPSGPNGPSALSRDQDEVSHPTLLDSLPKTYAEAARSEVGDGQTGPLATLGPLANQSADTFQQLRRQATSIAPRVTKSPAESLFFDDAERVGTQGGRIVQNISRLVAGSTATKTIGSYPSPQDKELVDPANASEPGRIKLPSPRRVTLRAGDFINAALLTAIDSEIPGTVVAQVTRSVFDHGTGRTLIIPQGARLVGKYDGRPPFGQRRAMITWREIVMPDGGALDLGSMVGTDSSGASGVEDSVDTHISPIVRAIALSTALTIGGAAAQSANSRSSGGFILNDAASGVSTRASEVGQRFVDRDLNQPPTLRVRPGWPISVIVEHDLAAPAYTIGATDEFSR